MSLQWDQMKPNLFACEAILVVSHANFNDLTKRDVFIFSRKNCRNINTKTFIVPRKQIFPVYRMIPGMCVHRGRYSLVDAMGSLK